MKRNAFSLSHHKLLSCDMGELVPIGMYEVLPGDTVQQASTMLVRASPLLAPVMHPVHVDVWHFFVPNRLVWTNWESFIVNPDSGFTIPVRDVKANSHASRLLATRLGAGYQNTAVGTTFFVNALPLRAYNLIFNEFCGNDLRRVS